MITKRSLLGNKTRVEFYQKVKLLVSLTIVSVSTFFCLTVIHVEFDFIGYYKDNVSWFRTNRNISIFLRIQEETFLFQPRGSEKWKSVFSDANVVYFVTSSPNHRGARSAIRNTWGQNSKPRPIFITGFVENKTEMDFLYNEAKLFNDIIIEDILDTYSNLTLKTSFIFKHYLKLFPDTEYLMKTDDDVLINTDIVERIVKETKKSYASGCMPIIGKLFQASKHKPHRDRESKWFMPYWMYGETYLPAYVSGTGYLTPGKSVHLILKSALQVPLISLEDVFFTGLVANNTLKIPLIDHKAFVDKILPSMEICSLRKLATLHHVSPLDLIKYWKMIRGKNSYCEKSKQQSIFR